MSIKQKRNPNKTMKVKFILAAMWIMAMLMGYSMDINRGLQNSGIISTGDLSKSTVKKNINISQFSKIKASNGIQVIYTQGKFTGTAEVQMTPTAEKYLRIEVDNGELELGYHGYRKENINGPTIVKVQAPELTSIDLSSAASVNVNGNLKVNDKLEIELSSASSVAAGDVSGKKVDIVLSSASSVTVGNLDINKLEIVLSSASSCTVGKVTAVDMDAELSSTSKCEIAGFNGTKIDSEASSASSLKIYGIVAQTVKAEASSGANITLEGKCGSLYADKSSGASIDTSRLNSDNGNAPSNKRSSSKKRQQQQPSNQVMPREP